MKKEMTSLLCVVGAYTLWGVLPVYWRLLAAVPAQVVLAQRMFWSIIFLAFVLLAQRRIRKESLQLLSPSVLRMRSLAAGFITANWLTYVWAMGNGKIVEAGLGYFISPLCSVALAAVLFRERLTPAQALGISVTAVGVLLKVLLTGAVPWIALLLGGSWALYNAVKKARPADPVSSLYQECLLAFPFVALAILCFSASSLLAPYGVYLGVLLLLSGPITAVPILMLVYGLRTVPLRHVALIQFLTPSLNMLMALLAGETLRAGDLFAFSVIWLGIALYLGVDRVLRLRRYGRLATTS
jgi:chloramphenicol-sensitive protein RarD